MKFAIIYNIKKDYIRLIFDNPVLYEKSLYKETMEELEDFKKTLNSNFEADVIVDELDKTMECKSRFTNHVFHHHYKTLDADEICYTLHEVAVMDNIVIYLEEFSTAEPITIPYDETLDDNFDE